MIATANLSMKRRVVDRLPNHAGFGTIELFDMVDLVRTGETIQFVLDEPVVAHDQSLGFDATSRLEYHNGRTIGGFRRRRMVRADWLRIAGAAGLAMYRFSIRTIRQAWRKDIPRHIVIFSIPAVVWLHYCAGAGELVGYAIGPGNESATASLTNCR